MNTIKEIISEWKVMHQEDPGAVWCMAIAAALVGLVMLI